MSSTRFTSVCPTSNSGSATRSRNGSSRSADSEDKIIINIGGQKFVTHSATLKNVPGTLLAKLDSDSSYYDQSSGEYFFDKNPLYFASILDFYRTGYLHFPHCYCGPVIKAELEFWGIDENCIADCCWKSYKKYYEQKKTLDELQKSISTGRAPVDSEQLNWFCRWKNYLWRFLDKPSSSKGAQIWAIIFFVLILVSIAVVVMETHPQFRVKRNGFEISEYTEENKTVNPKLILYYETTPHKVLKVLDGITVVIFTLELIIRFAACPSKFRFIKSFFNIIDILSVLPLFVVFLINVTTADFLLGEQSIILIGYLSLTSVLRVFRLFKIARQSRNFMLLVLTMKSSVRELFLLIMLLCMGMLIFSTCIYFAEFQVDNNLTSIPIGFWWSIITMTTVGYGDITPSSGVGFIIGGFCAVCGLLITGLPIPILASTFNHYHRNARFANSLASKTSPVTVWKGPATREQSSANTSAGLFRTPRRVVINYTDDIYNIERDPLWPTRVRRARSAFTPLFPPREPPLIHVTADGEIVNSNSECSNLQFPPFTTSTSNEDSRSDERNSSNTLNVPRAFLFPTRSR